MLTGKTIKSIIAKHAVTVAWGEADMPLANGVTKDNLPAFARAIEAEVLAEQRKELEKIDHRYKMQIDRVIVGPVAGPRG